jgi:hypothetical protein
LAYLRTIFNNPKKPVQSALWARAVPQIVSAGHAIGAAPGLKSAANLPIRRLARHGFSPNETEFA